MIEAIILDVDGTLVDSADGICAAYDRTFRELGLNPPSASALLRTIGTPTRQNLQSLLGGEQDVAQALASFRAWFKIEGVARARCYDGIITMVEQLRARPARLFVCTAQPQQTAVQTLQHLGLDHYFDNIYGAEEDGGFENKRDLLGFLLAHEKLDAASAVMVGDRASDIVAALAHAMRAVAVTWGYGTRSELVASHPFALCDRPAALADIVRHMLAGASV